MVEEKERTSMGALYSTGIIVLMGLILVMTPLIVGAVIAQLWNWFITPTGFSAMSFPVGVCIFLLVRLATWRFQLACCREFNVGYHIIISALFHNIVAALVLGFGWVLLRLI